jgi:phosphoglycolate phosphatase
MNYERYQLIIFDWDGTLMDSINRIVSSVQAAAKSCSLNVPDNSQVRDIIGLSLPKAMKTLFPNINGSDTAKLIEQYKHQFIAVNDIPMPLFIDTIDLLNTLTQHDKILAIATGKGREGLQRVFKQTHTGHYFKASRCADEASSKPSPEMLLSLLDELKIAKDRALMVGDSKYDLQMAKTAGIDCIGVTFGVHSRAELSLYQPIAIVDSLTELQGLLITNING